MKSFENLMKRYGQDISLHMSDGWNSEIFQAFIQPLRYKNKLYLEGIHTDIGLQDTGSYLYIGPSNHDASKLPYDAYIKDFNNKKYSISRCEKVYMGKDIFYVWAIIKEIQEAEYE